MLNQFALPKIEQGNLRSVICFLRSHALKWTGKCRSKARHDSLAIYILLRGITLLVRCGNKNNAPEWVRKLLTPTRMEHGDTLLMCLCTAQIAYSWIIKPHTMPPSFIAFLNHHGGHENWYYVAAKVNLATIPQTHLARSLPEVQAGLLFWPSCSLFLCRWVGQRDPENVTSCIFEEAKRMGSMAFQTADKGTATSGLRTWCHLVSLTDLHFFHGADETHPLCRSWQKGMQRAYQWLLCKG